MKTIVKFMFSLLLMTYCGSDLFAQCTEFKDADMAKYKKIAEKDPQACSICAQITLYFCSATHCVTPEDKARVGKMIDDCKKVMRSIDGTPCCPELLSKQPQWGVNAGKSKNGVSSGKSSSTSDDEPAGRRTSGPTVEETEMLLKAGVDMVNAFSDIHKENVAYKNDYQKFYNQAKRQLYKEVDENLQIAQIAANIGLTGTTEVSPIFKHDLANGNKLLVKDGVLQLVGSNGLLLRNLFRVGESQNGILPKDWCYDQTALKIADNDEVFYVGQFSNISQDNCFNCLTSGLGFVLDSKTGSVIAEGKKGGMYPKFYENPVNYELGYSFFKNNELVFYSIHASTKKRAVLTKFRFKGNRKNSLDKNDYDYYREFDKQKSFLIDDVTRGFRSFTSDNTGVLIVNEKSKIFEDDVSNFCLLWAREESNFYFNGHLDPFNGGTMVQIASGLTPVLGDGLANKFTGFVHNKKTNEMVYTTSDGVIGKFSTNGLKYSDSKFYTNLTNADGVRIFEDYDFVLGKPFLSAHGFRGSGNNGEQYTPVPMLLMTSDFKWIIYIQKTKLYVISSMNFEEYRGFDLGVEPYNCFLNKEKSGFTLTVQSLDPHMFPISKKYMLSVLLPTSGSTEKSNESVEESVIYAEEIKESKPVESTANAQSVVVQNKADGVIEELAAWDKSFGGLKVGMHFDDIPYGLKEAFDMSGAVKVPVGKTTRVNCFRKINYGTGGMFQMMATGDLTPGAGSGVSSFQYDEDSKKVTAISVLLLEGKKKKLESEAVTIYNRLLEEGKSQFGVDKVVAMEPYKTKVGIISIESRSFTINIGQKAVYSATLQITGGNVTLSEYIGCL